jgi:hypothetical protein
MGILLKDTYRFGAHAKRVVEGQVLSKAIKEADWQTLVIAWAVAGGWFVAHFTRALVGGRYMTPVRADGAGFPDLVLVRERIIYAELKTDTGHVHTTQKMWGCRLKMAGGDHRIWRPRDHAAISGELLAPRGQSEG